MTSKEVDAILDQLMRLLWEVDRADTRRYNAMMDASQDIRAWDRAGREGDIPHRAQLLAWKVGLPDAASRSDDVPAAPAPTPADAAQTAAPEAPVAPTPPPPAPPAEASVAEAPVAEAPPPPAPEPVPAADPDDALQAAYDRALDHLEAENFQEAKRLLAGLAEQARGRLRGDVARRYEQARIGLGRQVQPLIDAARAFAQEHPDDLEGRNERWREAEAIDPDNEAVKAGLRELAAAREEVTFREEIEEIRRNTQLAAASLRLTDLERNLSLAAALRDRIGNPRLIGEVNELIDGVEVLRDQLRTELGRPTTLLVTDMRAAYKEALALRGKNVAQMVDQAGIMDQGVGAVVGTFGLTERIRGQFLSNLRDLVAQRHTTAAQHKASSPPRAREAMLEAQRLLDDEILTADDKQELEHVRKGVEEELAVIQVLLDNYLKAQNKLLEARKPETPAREKFDLLVAAQEDYADYPGLEEQLEIARDGIAALEATKLTNQMTEADRLRRKDDYAGAIALLKEARAAAITAVPHPKPGSPLQERLDDLARLIDDIVAAEERYNRMLEQLDAVARLMDDYERDKTPQSLQKARGMMATLSEDEQKHPKTLEQLVRLSQLQTVDENWEQGLSAYRRGQWDNAIKLLERVAKAEAQQSQEAGKLVKRANAAGDVLSAQQAEEEGRYADALNIYKDAEETFTQQESDLRTAEFDAKARDGRARMELKTTNDAEARRVLTDAERRLTAANKRAADRRGVGDKVQPIADFATIVDQLAVALALDSTLKNEIEARWSLARQSWLVAYRAGLQAAIGSDDMTTLERAKALGRELEQNDLLIEPDDKRLYRQVEEKWLDAQAKQLRRATNVNWAAIEANRQRRIEIGGEIPEIMREYAEAAESRVLSEMEQLSNQRRRREGDELNYLRQQLDTNPALLHNSRLVEEFMGMLWRDKRWVEAEKRAAQLAHRRLENARVLSRVWLGLTKAAKYLKERDEKTFNAEMSRLEDYLTDNAEAGLRPLYDRQRRALIEDAVGKLVEEAQSRTRQGSEPDIVAATSLYALANRIDPDDAQVAADLEGLRPQLHSIIANRLLDAKALVATVPLKQTIQEGKSLLGLLRNIDQVADVAGLPHGVREELTAGIADLEAKLNGWDEVWKQLDRVDVEIQRAKTEPYPFEGSSGGWDFQSANRQWSNTQQSAQNRGLGGDLAVQAELQTRKREIEALGRLGSELNNHVKALLNALDNEEFEPARPDNPDDPSPRAGWPAEAQPNGSSYGIDNAATLLDGAWSGALARGFAGLEKALYREGHPTNIPLHATADYQRAAQRQRDNFDQWRAWARRVNDDHEQLERAAKLLKRDLDALRLDATLDNLLEQCQEILRLCEQFTVNAAGRPRTIPLSRKAATQKNSVNLAWQDEVETADSGLRHKAQALLEAIEKDKAKLPPLLDSLDNVMRNLRTNSQPTIRGVLIKRENPPDATVVRRWLKRAREQLKACLDVDPQHLKVQEAKKEIEAIENRFATSKSPARE